MVLRLSKSLAHLAHLGRHGAFRALRGVSLQWFRRSLISRVYPPLLASRKTVADDFALVTNMPHHFLSDLAKYGDLSEMDLVYNVHSSEHESWSFVEPFVLQTRPNVVRT